MSMPSITFARSRQTGAATLIIVMILFFIMAMVAAYASRNQILEQRIASNYVRTSVAADMADAGIDWALAMLNGDNVDNACLANPSSGSTFRQRYLSVNPTTRTIVTVPMTPPSVTSQFNSSCVRLPDGTWSCQCGTSTWAEPTNLPSSTQPLPSFGVKLLTLPKTSATNASYRSGLIRITSLGCTDSDTDTCSNTFISTASNQLLGSVQVYTYAALISALQMPPAAPLVVRQSLSTDSSGIGLHNSDPGSAGLLMVSGASLPTLVPSRLDSVPGTPPLQALLGNDSTLGGLDLTTDADAMFRLYFGMASGAYREQPALRVVSCDGDCGTAIRTAYTNGARMVWIDGDLSLTGDTDIGTAASPLVIVANGNVSVTGPLRIYGLVYAYSGGGTNGNFSWSNSGSSGTAVLNGAVIAEGTTQVSGNVDLWYSSAIMDLLSNTTGSFVRVPGSWYDSKNGG